jgi:hypothetical protein
MGRIKTGGRKAGTLNRNSKMIRESYQLLLESNLEQLDQDIKQMKPRERVKTLLELSKFILPTLKSVELEAKTEHQINPIVIQLSEETDQNHYEKFYNK